MADATTVSRRDFMKDTGIGSVAALAAGCTTPANILVPKGEILRYDVVVIGSGFGGTIAATELAATGKKVLILERGTWWISPEFLGAPPDPTGRPKPLRRWLEENKAPLQFWARPDHAEGLKDLFRAIRQPANPKGLYEYSTFGQAHVLTSSGVGGGSLIYSNVTLKPKDRVLAGLQAADLRLGPADWDAARMWTTTRRGVLNRIVTKIPLPKDKDAARLSKDDEYLYLDRSRALRNVAENVGRQVADDKTAEWLPLDLAVIEYDPTPGSDATSIRPSTLRSWRKLVTRPRSGRWRRPRSSSASLTATRCASRTMTRGSYGLHRPRPSLWPPGRWAQPPSYYDPSAMACRSARP